MALQALRGEVTAAQLAARHGVHQTMVGEWKRKAIEGLAGVFSGKLAAHETAKSTEAELEKLHPKIGQLVGRQRTGTWERALRGARTVV